MPLHNFRIRKLTFDPTTELLQSGIQNVNQRKENLPSGFTHF